MARTCTQNGIEKDFQEGLKMESFRQKETGKAKNDPEKIFEGDFKNMELTWRTADSEAKDRNSWRKRSGCLILKQQKKKKKKSWMALIMFFSSYYYCPLYFKHGMEISEIFKHQC